MFWRKLYLLASSRISIHVLLFHVISHSLVVGLNAPAIYKFSLPSILETLQSSKFIEYSHIPKCGTASRKICDQGQLPCLPLLQLRKCGHHGEDCDWLAKYNCVGKKEKFTFYTLLREPLSRVRSHYNYFYPGACRNGKPLGQPAGQFWTKSMCENEHNFTAWLLTPDNWVHNRMTRMAHGRKGSGNLCRITPREEKKFWASVLRSYGEKCISKEARKNPGKNQRISGNFREGKI